MLVSFVIPFYNEEENLFEFLTSLKESIDSFENYEFEIILINDSSTDNGRELVLDFISNDGRFRLIDNIKNSNADRQSSFIIHCLCFKSMAVFEVGIDCLN